ncbi:hypothetical protein [Methylophaga thalassica]|uniref:hypothetical protein n=1 Tax=Methylophaga aminisulfidivorans TaxID=230105 RepID=UPI003A8D8AC8
MIKKQSGNTASQFLLWLLVLVNTAGIAYYYYQTEIKAKQIPNLVGTWSGVNLTVSDEKGYKTWDDKTVTITEQQDRRFRGTFTYADGTKHFFGVIYPDNKSFTWVSTPSHGYVHGRILNDNTIGTCYVETWEHATAGCAKLERQK